MSQRQNHERFLRETCCRDTSPRVYWYNSARAKQVIDRCDMSLQHVPLRANSTWFLCCITSLRHFPATLPLMWTNRYAFFKKIPSLAHWPSKFTELPEFVRFLVRRWMSYTQPIINLVSFTSHNSWLQKVSIFVWFSLAHRVITWHKITNTQMGEYHLGLHHTAVFSLWVSCCYSWLVFGAKMSDLTSSVDKLTSLRYMTTIKKFSKNYLFKQCYRRL